MSSSPRQLTRALAAALVALAVAVPLGSPGFVPPAAAEPSSATRAASTAAAEPRVPVYTPNTRAWFNDPLGDEYAKRRLFRHITRSVDSTPKDAVIRFAVFSFADKVVADALLRAHRRGVTVKLLFAGSNVYEPMKRMQRALGKNPSAESFAIFCDQSCRGDAGQMHAKFFSFSQVGRARWVTMVGSNNLTRHNSHDQWSDLYTQVGDEAYFKLFGRWFGQAKKDRPLAEPYVNREIGTQRVIITPVDLDKHPDPLVEALDSVTCLTRAGDIDPEAADPEAMEPTNLLFAQHAWNGPRGKRLAKQVAGMLRQGCTARVFYGEGVGPAVRNILGSAGADLRSGTHRGVLTHQKLLIANGHVGLQPDAVRVWTGSQNWSTRSRVRDDLIVRIDDQRVAKQYVRGFFHMWTTG